MNAHIGQMPSTYEGGISPPEMIHRVYRLLKLFGADGKGGVYIMELFDILIGLVSLSAIMFQAGFCAGRFVEKQEHHTESKSNPPTDQRLRLLF